MQCSAKDAPDAAEAELLCIGNALVDIFVRAEGDLAAPAWGDPRVRHIGHEEMAGILARLNASPGARILGTGSGGGAANVAKIAALLGVRTAFAGSVGSDAGGPDPYARLFEGELERAGVRLFLSPCRVPTGVFVTLTAPSGESRIVAAPAAALEFSPEDIPEEALKTARVVVLDGYMLTRDRLVQRVLSLADRWGTAVALDLGSADLAAARAEKILRWLRDYPLILFMNEAEARAFYYALCGAEGQSAAPQGEEPLERNIRSFLKGLTLDGPFPIIAVKRGKRGAAIYARGERYPARARIFVPGDTAGAGDAFCAGFLAGWLRDRPLLRCAALGNRTARKVLGAPGTMVDFRRFRPIPPVQGGATKPPASRLPPPGGDG
jgi:sugar/nucleoside kinase (ribokinase family)